MLVKCISAFTAGAYALEAEELSRSMQNCVMPLETYEYGPFESWNHAVAAKPDFIAQKLETLGEQFDGLLWLDSDARFRSEPDWSILKDADIACTRFRWSPGHQWELLTGTFYVKRGLTDFCREWSHVTQSFRHTDTPEQRGLEVALRNWPTIKLVELPVAWCFIEPEMYGIHPGVVPRFRHTQASRRLRK